MMLLHLGKYLDWSLRGSGELQMCFGMFGKLMQEFSGVDLQVLQVLNL